VVGCAYHAEGRNPATWASLCHQPSQSHKHSPAAPGKDNGQRAAPLAASLGAPIEPACEWHRSRLGLRRAEVPGPGGRMRTCPVGNDDLNWPHCDVDSNSHHFAPGPVQAIVFTRSRARSWRVGALEGGSRRMCRRSFG